MTSSSMTSSSRRPIWFAALAVGLVLIIYPFSLTAAPEWTVKVVDEKGTPLGGAWVWMSATFQRWDFDHDEWRCTNRNGEVRCERHTIRASVVKRVSRLVPALLNVHDGSGPNLDVAAERLGMDRHDVMYTPREYRPGILEKQARGDLDSNVVRWMPYLIRYRPLARSADGARARGRDEFEIEACCERYGPTCTRGYLLDTAGVIHGTGEARRAESGDPAIVDCERQRARELPCDGRKAPSSASRSIWGSSVEQLMLDITRDRA